MFIIALIIILWIILGLAAYKLISLEEGFLNEEDFVMIVALAPLSIVIALLYLAVVKLKDFVDSL